MLFLGCGGFLSNCFLSSYFLHFFFNSDFFRNFFFDWSFNFSFRFFNFCFWSFNLRCNNFFFSNRFIFCNLSKVSEISCPVFLIHGLQDEVIPSGQSLEMMTKIKNSIEWFPKRGNHSNITVKYRSKFLSEVRQFLDQLNYSQQSNSIKPKSEFRVP